MNNSEALNNISARDFSNIAKDAIKQLMKEPDVVARPKPVQAPVPPASRARDNNAAIVSVPPPIKPAPINGVVNFTWDSEACSEHILLSDKKMGCFLMEAGYCFRSVTGTLGIMGGIAYWEIQIDSRNENELKVGVVKKKGFNYNTVFVY